MYDAYKKAKARRKDAQRVLGLIGKASPGTTARSIGKPQTIKVTATVHHQASDGAKNYHTCGSLDEALSAAAMDTFTYLAEAAMEKLVGDERDALVAAEAEIKALMSEIGEASRGKMSLTSVPASE